MDSETFHESEGPGNGPIGHRPHDHVHAFGHKGNEVPEVVMCSLSLREFSVGLRLGRMNQIRKLDRILNEEYRNVVPNNVPVSLLRIELYGKPSNVSRQVGGPLVSCNG